MTKLHKRLVLVFTGLALFACSDDSSDDSEVMDGSTDASTSSDASTSTDGTTPMDAATGDGNNIPTNPIPDASTESDAETEYTYPDGDGSWAEGPYKAITVKETGPDNVYTLYYPEDFAPDDELNPIIVWGNGGMTTPDLYTMLPHLATHGFVVIAPNNTVVTGPELIAGVEWLLEQNEDDTSDLYQQLDPEKIGAMGYSNGSLATYAMLADSNRPDIVTTVHVSGGIWASNPEDQDLVLNEPGPTAYFCDATPVDETGTKENCDTDFDVVEVPVFYASILDDAVHISIPFPPHSIRVAGGATAWFRWHLMGHDHLESVFLGEDCEICQDPGFSVQVKNWD